MKFYLWFCSMIASIVYIFESLFNYMNGIQAIYFIFVLMIALERTVTHYKKFIDFLESENLYENNFREKSHLKYKKLYLLSTERVNAILSLES